MISGKNLLGVFLLMGASSLNFAHAAFVHTDLSVAGDKKVTLDTSTGIEWMKLGNYAGFTLNALQSLMLDGGALSGWRLPTENEVEGLMSSFFSGRDFSDGAKSYALTGTSAYNIAYAADSWFGWMGSTGSYYQGYPTNESVAIYSALGGYISESGASQKSGVYSYQHRITSNPIHWNTSYTMFSDQSFGSVIGRSDLNATTSFFLVSDGGHTLSSIQDPTLNANNPNAPMNQQPSEPEVLPTDVSAPVGAMAFVLSFLGLGLRRRTV